MGCGVPHDGQTVLGIEGDRLNLVTIVKRGVQVTGFAVETHGDDVFVVAEEIDASLACMAGHGAPGVRLERRGLPR